LRDGRNGWVFCSPYVARLLPDYWLVIPFIPFIPSKYFVFPEHHVPGGFSFDGIYRIDWIGGFARKAISRDHAEPAISSHPVHPVHPVQVLRLPRTPCAGWVLF